MRRRSASPIAAILLAPSLAIAVDPAFAEAARQAAAGDCATADRTIRPYLQSRGKSDPNAYRLLADCYGKTGQFPQAVSILREGVAALPSSAVVQRSLGVALFRQDAKNAEAGELLRRASQALPGDPEANHYYAQWAFVNGRDEICVRKEQAGLRSPGLNDLALLQMFTLLAMCQNRLEEVAAAKASFLKARAINLKRNAFDPMAAYQYVQLLTRVGENEEAMRIVDEILERAPAFGPAHLERAKSFERERHPTEAIEAARAALSGEAIDASNERAAHGILARCYFLAGNSAAAEQEQRWIEQHPNPATRR